MSTDNYVKYISEQVNKEKVRGFTDVALDEGVELTSEDYINMLHMYIEDLESHFEAEDLQQIQELSKDTLDSYKSKAAKDFSRKGAPFRKMQKRAAGMGHAQMRTDPEHARKMVGYGYKTDKKAYAR